MTRHGGADPVVDFGDRGSPVEQMTRARIASNALMGLQQILERVLLCLESLAASVFHVEGRFFYPVLYGDTYR